MTRSDKNYYTYSRDKNLPIAVMVAIKEFWRYFETLGVLKQAFSSGIY